MSFFQSSDVNVEEFEKICKKFVYSRSLAQIQPETLEIFQEKFEERCNDLLILKQNIPDDPLEKQKYKDELGTIWDLFDFIDLEAKKIKFEKGESPKPLIHFFADKIVKSFLTEDFKVASAFE